MSKYNNLAFEDKIQLVKSNSLWGSVLNISKIRKRVCKTFKKWQIIHRLSLEAISLSIYKIQIKM